jgi:hypothetical protein
MNNKQASKTNWVVSIISGSSIPITLMVAGIIIKLLAWAFHPLQQLPLMDPNDTTIENAVLFGGLFLALPFGLLNIIVGRKALSEGLVKKRVSITGIIIGILGILMGLLAWASFYMVSMIEF